MKQHRLFLALLIAGMCHFVTAQDDSGDYLEFNDRNNVVHGVYLGFTTHYGEINGKDTYIGGLKIAYVANQQFEVGFEGKFFYSDQNFYNDAFTRNEDLFGAYGGLHLEPILFSKSKVNLSFPVLIGLGAVGYIGEDFDEEEFEDDFDDVDVIFVVEPGVSALFNVSRYLQLEAGVKYRISNRFNIENSNISRLNGFSAGIGVKVGVFNMGRNRYKKNIR